jgi:hypothetical protein
VTPPNQRERAEKQRRERLELMDKQVEEGSLTIRQMTPAERKRWPKPDEDARPRRGRPRKGS